MKLSMIMSRLSLVTLLLLVFTGLFAQEIYDWENPEVVGINKVKARAHFMEYEKAR